MDKKEDKRKIRHWYFVTEEECVLCWRHNIYRERRYTPKPEKYEDRHRFIQYMCGNHY